MSDLGNAVAAYVGGLILVAVVVSAAAGAVLAIAAVEIGPWVWHHLSVSWQ